MRGVLICSFCVNTRVIHQKGIAYKIFDMLELWLTIYLNRFSWCLDLFDYLFTTKRLLYEEFKKTNTGGKNDKRE
jgi:hypothetical protein